MCSLINYRQFLFTSDQDTKHNKAKCRSPLPPWCLRFYYNGMVEMMVLCQFTVVWHCPTLDVSIVYNDNSCAFSAVMSCLLLTIFMSVWDLCLVVSGNVKTKNVERGISLLVSPSGLSVAFYFFIISTPTTFIN